MVLWSKKVGRFSFRYYSRWNLLLVSFSAPKVLHGTNLYSYSQRDYSRLNLFFQEALHEAIPDICAPKLAQWTVSRIDYSQNYIVDTLPYSPDAVITIIDFAKKSGAPYCKTKEYSTGSFNYNKRRAIKVYDKATELVVQNDDHIFDEEDYVIRIEVQLQKRLYIKLMAMT